MFQSRSQQAGCGFSIRIERNSQMKKLLLLAAVALSFAAQAVTPDEILTKGGCLACHTKDKKVVGPSYKDVAVKYKGQDASVRLIEKVRKGGVGVYGPIPMPANAIEKISDADLKTAVDYSLKL
jgi:cytochrome c